MVSLKTHDTESVLTQYSHTLPLHCALHTTCYYLSWPQCHAYCPSCKWDLFTDESEEGDFFYDEEEVLNGVGAENRAALLQRYDAMLDDSEQPEFEEVCLPPCCSRL